MPPSVLADIGRRPALTRKPPFAYFRRRYELLTKYLFDPSASNMERAERSSLPGYRVVLTAIGAAYVLLAVMNVAQGAAKVLEPFGVPDHVLKSEHFLDFYHWHFAHMGNIGVLLVVLARVVAGLRAQRVVVLALIAVQLHYTYLDWRTSVLGNGLYADPRSIVLIAINLGMVLAFASILLRERTASKQH